MNIPYKFTFTATNDYGVLWNPWGADVSGLTTQSNTMLLGNPDPVGNNMIPPTGAFWLTGITAMVDSAGDGKFTFGYYDLTAAVWVPLYAVLATDVAGGGIAHSFGSEGRLCPSSATKVPCLKYNGSAGATVSGSLDLWANPTFNNDGSAAFDVILDETGASLLDETGALVYSN